MTSRNETRRAKAASRWRRWIPLSVGVLLVLGALGYTLRTPPPPSMPAAPVCVADLKDVAPPPLSERVTYAWHLGNRVGFPVVHGRIAACDVGIFLDTGVSAPLMMSWFADRLRLPRTRTDAIASDLGGYEGAVDHG